MKYWAFISYSSRDRRWGEWLHRRLENFPIPPDLQGQVLFDGGILGKNLRPVFRDRDELPGSADLAGAIQQALRTSRYLVVLCSRNSARSEWVEKEIQAFRALGREKQILALILDGEPNASSGPNPQDECFPPALRHPAEPIAGDLRKEGDGPQRGFLKILAGIAQLDFDALFRRHEKILARQRRMRSALAASLVLVFGILAGLAIWQGKEAGIQRDAATASLARIYSGKGTVAELDHDYSDAALLYLRALELCDLPSARMGAEAVLEKVPRPLMYLSLKDIGISAIAWSRDGKIMALGTAKGTIFLVDTYSGQKILTLEGHENYVQDLVFAADGSLLYSASWDDTVRSWDLASGKESFRITTNAVLNTCIALSNDGTMLAWKDSDDRVAIAALNGRGHGLPRYFVSGKVHDLAFLSGEKLLATAGSHGVLILDTDDGSRVFKETSPLVKIHKLAPAPDGRRLFGTDSETLFRIDPDNPGSFWNKHVHSEMIRSLALSPDGRFAATGGQDHMLRISWADTGESVLAQAFSGNIVSLAFSPDSKKVAVATYDGLWILELPDFSPLVPVQLPVNVPGYGGAATMLSNDLDVATITTPHKISIRDPQNGRVLGEILETDTEIMESSIFPDGKSLAYRDQAGTIRYADLPGGAVTRVIDGYPGGSCLAIDPQGKLLAAGTRSHSVAVLDRTTGTLRGELETGGGGISCLSFSPDGLMLAAMTTDGNLIIWNPRNLESLLVKRIESSFGIGFLPDGRFFHDYGQGLEIIDPRTGLSSLSIKGDLACTAGSTDGKYIAAFVPGKQVVCLWEAHTGELVREFQGLPRNDMYSDMKFSLDGKRLVLAGPISFSIDIPGASRQALVDRLSKLKESRYEYFFDDQGERVFNTETAWIRRYASWQKSVQGPGSAENSGTGFAGDSAFRSLLCQAAGEGRTSLLVQAFDQGISVNLRDDEGHGLLDLAVAGDRIDTVRMLLEKGAVPDFGIKDFPLLHRALGSCRSAEIPLLLLAACPSGTPLDKNLVWQAAADGFAPVLSSLAERGLDLGAADDQGNTALHFLAAGKASPDTARLLLDRGLGIDKQNKDGWTALFAATLGGKTGLVRYLLSRGADASLPGRIELEGNMTVMTALRLAQYLGDSNLAALLESESQKTESGPGK